MGRVGRQEDSISLNQSADPPSRPAHAPSLIFQSNAAAGELKGISIFLSLQFEANVAFCEFPTFQRYCSSRVLCSEQILSLLSFSHSPPKSVWRQPLFVCFHLSQKCKFHRSARCGNLSAAALRLVDTDKDRKSLFSPALSSILKRDRTKRKRSVLAR